MMKIPFPNVLERSVVLVAIIAAIGFAPAFSQELEIERPEKVPESKLSVEGWEKVGKDLYRGDIRVPPDFLSRGDAQEDGDDPFGEVSKSAQQILEDAGVPFPDGASATFLSELSILRAVNTRANLELLQAYFDLMPEPPKRIALRTEIYELTQLQVLQLLESGAAENDHTPERDAAAKLVRDGHAKLVAAHSVITTSGLRVKVDDTAEVQVARTAKVPASNQEQEGDETKEPPIAPGTVIEFDVWPYGTIVEAEPIIDSDGITIALTIAIEHHTAEPQMDVIVEGIVSPRFHAKKIQTSCVLVDGLYLILGNWKPTGKPEYVDSDLRHIVFVTASIQTVEPGG